MRTPSITLEGVTVKHERSDYNERIQDSAGLIPEDEPVFLLRGQDPAAPAALEAYANLLDMINVSNDMGGVTNNVKNDMISGVRNQILAMKNWQDMNGSRVHAPNL